MNESDQRRLFLLVSPNIKRRDQISFAIQHQVENSVVFVARDGLEGSAKIDTARPHILITEREFAKSPNAGLIQNILRGRRQEPMGIIIINPSPDPTLFAEEVKKGMIQYLTEPDNEEAIAKCLAHALNYIATDPEVRFKLRVLAPNEILFRKGETADTVYIVKRGVLRAFDLNGPDETVFGQIETGEFVGEMAYVNGEPRSAFVAASTECELIEIPIGNLDYLLAQKPNWSKSLIKTLVKRIKMANRRA